MMPPNRQEREAELQRKFRKLKFECNTLAGHMQTVLDRGQVTLERQCALNDQVQFLKSFPLSCTTLDKLVNCVVELNCILEIVTSEVVHSGNSLCDSSKCSSETSLNDLSENSPKQVSKEFISSTFEEFASLISESSHSSFCSVFSTIGSENVIENSRSPPLLTDSPIRNNDTSCDTHFVTSLSACHNIPESPDTVNSGSDHNVSEHGESSCVSESATEYHVLNPTCDSGFSVNLDQDQVLMHSLVPENNSQCTNLPDCEEQSQSFENITSHETETPLVGNTDSCDSDSTIVVPLCPNVILSKKRIVPSRLQPGSIWEMSLSHWASPWNFWLHPYSTKDIDALHEQMLVKHQKGALVNISLPVAIGDHFSAFDGVRYFRGQVLSVTDFEIVFLDVDSGRSIKVDISNVWELDEEMQNLPAQAINCQWLEKLEECDKWAELVGELFLAALTNHIVIITISGIEEGNPPQHIVNVDVVDKDSDIPADMNKWLVLIKPKLAELQKMALSVHQLHSLLDPFTVCVNGLELPPIIMPEPDRDDVKCSGEATPSTDLVSSECCTGFDEDMQQAYLADVAVVDSVSKIDVSYSLHNSGENPEALNLCKKTEIELPMLDQSQSDPILINLETKSSISCNIFPDVNSERCVNRTTGEDVSPTSRVMLLKKDYSSSVGREYDVMYAYGENPGCFFVHVVCEEATHIDELKTSMTQFYSVNKGKFATKEMAKKHIGKYCACLFPADNLWYRAEIIDWLDENPELVSVFYVDYGNRMKVPLNMIQPLWTAYAEYPIFAQRCHLALVCPPSPDEKWPLESTNAFLKLMSEAPVLKMIVMESARSKDSLSVLLARPELGNNCLINDYLISSGFANELPASHSNQVKETTHSNQVKETTHSNQVKETSYLDEWDPMKEDYISEKNVLDYDDENACLAVSGYIPKDEARVCKFYARNGKCYKGIGCRNAHILTNPDGWTTDREPVYTDAFSKVNLPSEGQMVMLSVTEVVSVKRFYAQIARTSMPSAGDEEETLGSLQRYINTSENVKKLRRLPVTPAVGQLVLALYSADNMWYRGRVVDTDNDKGTVDVFFVDYGNIDVVDEKNIRDIEAQYIHLPFQAVECFIANIENKDFDDYESCFSALLRVKNMLMIHEPLHARIVARREELGQLDVILYKSGDSSDMGSIFVQQKICLPKSDDSIPNGRENVDLPKKFKVNQTALRVIPG